MAHLNDKSGFPSFSDGDVYIYISANQTYNLHSRSLAYASTTLRSLLSEAHTSRSTGKHSKKAEPKYWLCLVERSGLEEDYTLQTRPPSSDIIAFSGSTIPRDIATAYDNYFKLIYHVDVNIEKRDFGPCLRDCMALIKVAQKYNSASLVGPVVEASLLSQRETPIQISRKPVGWATKAFLIHAEGLFKEAVIHLVGQWNSLRPHEKEDLAPEVRSLCQAKADELSIAKSSAEMRIGGHYPGSIQRVADNNPGRSTYAKDIYTWMACSIFRQWLTQSLVDRRNHVAADGGYHFYKQIREGGYAYLDRTVMHGFHQLFPMTDKGIACLEGHLANYKEDLRRFVEPFFTNNSRLDLAVHTPAYLLCCEVKRSDVPWMSKATESAGSSSAGSASEDLVRDEYDVQGSDDEE